MDDTANKDYIASKENSTCTNHTTNISHCHGNVHVFGAPKIHTSIHHLSSCGNVYAPMNCLHGGACISNTCTPGHLECIIIILMLGRHLTYTHIMLYSRTLGWLGNDKCTCHCCMSKCTAQQLYYYLWHTLGFFHPLVGCRHRSSQVRSGRRPMILILCF